MHGLGYTRFNHLGVGGWLGPESNLSQNLHKNKIYTIHHYLGWVGGWVSDPFSKLEKKSVSGWLLEQREGVAVVCICILGMYLKFYILKLLL